MDIDSGEFMNTTTRFFGVAALILIMAAAGGASDDPVAAIQKLYARTQDLIVRALKAEKEGVGAGLYATEIVVNGHQAPWRAVGNYQKRTTFWFTDQPEFAAHDNLPPEGVLAKIDVKVEAAVRRENEEYLFDRGRLVFYYHREQYGDEPAQETRIYFKNDAPIKAISGLTVLGAIPDTSSIQKRTLVLVRLFLSSF
jgi:hypothetical protein